MNHYVYIITNLMNGRKYIGKRSCWEQIEDDKYMGSGYLLAKAKEKYGIENFEKKILLVCNNEDEAYKEEEKAIQLVEAWKNPMYYNLDGGGRGVGSGESHPGAKSVVCLNTGEVFDTSTEVKNKYNTSKVAVCECCKEMRKSAGKHPVTGEKLVWRWLEDYNNLTSENINHIIEKCQSSKNRKVVCLNTKEIFKSLIDVDKKYNISINSINDCISKQQKSAGTHPTTKEKLVWRYLEDYEKMTEDEIKNAIKNANINLRQHSKNKKNGILKRGIICVNTGEIFSTAMVALSKYNTTDILSIRRCCQGRIASAGIHPETKEPLVWMSVEDYQNKYGKINRRTS